MKCQKEKVVEIIMKFLTLRQFEVQIYIAFLRHNDHDNMSWSSLLSLLLTSENSCFTMEIFHWKIYFLRKHFFEACNSEFNISVIEVYSKTPFNFNGTRISLLIDIIPNKTQQMHAATVSPTPSWSKHTVLQGTYTPWVQGSGILFIFNIYFFYIIIT